MTSQKCTNCGLVSWADATTCKRCGESSFEESQTSVSADEPAQLGQVADWITCGFAMVGLCFLAFNRYLGPFGYPVSLLSWIIGVGYGIVRVYRSNQHPRLDRKSAAVAALISNAVMVLVMGAAIPIYFFGPNPEAKTFVWREHVSQVGHFTVQLPDDPEEFHQLFQTGRGPALTLQAVMADMGKRGKYISGYFDLVDQGMAISDDESLDLVFQTVANHVKGMVMVKRPLNFYSRRLSVQAMEGQIQIDLDNTSMFRLYWVRDRELVYINQVTLQKGDLNYASAEKFLNSFQLE